MIFSTLKYQLAVPAPGFPGFTEISQAFPEMLGISRHFQVYPRAFESLRKGPAPVKVNFFYVPGPINISASVHFRAFISLLRYPCKSKITLQSKFQPKRSSGYRDIAILFKIWPKFGPSSGTLGPIPILFLMCHLPYCGGSVSKFQPPRTKIEGVDRLQRNKIASILYTSSIRKR